MTALIFISHGYGCFSQKKPFFTEITPEGKIGLYKKSIAVAQSVLGLLLLVGLFTQAVALALALVSLEKLCFTDKNKTSANRSLYTLLFFVSLSFLFFGPGLFSLDYPL